MMFAHLTRLTKKTFNIHPWKSLAKLGETRVSKTTMPIKRRSSMRDGIGETMGRLIRDKFVEAILSLTPQTNLRCRSQILKDAMMRKEGHRT